MNPNPLQIARQKPSALMSSLMLNPNGSGRPALLVEGSTDKSFLQNFLPRRGPHVLTAAGSKKDALDVAATARTQGINVLAIVDADAEVVVGSPQRQNCDVAVTDLRDIEAMMFMSSAGDRFLSEYLRDEKVLSIEEEQGRPIKHIVLHLLAYVGALRTVSSRDRLMLNFKSLSVEKYVDPGKLRFDEKSYLRDLLGVSSGAWPASNVHALAIELIE